MAEELLGRRLCAISEEANEEFMDDIKRHILAALADEALIAAAEDGEGAMHTYIGGDLRGEGCALVWEDSEVQARVTALRRQELMIGLTKDNRIVVEWG